MATPACPRQEREFCFCCQKRLQMFQSLLSRETSLFVGGPDLNRASHAHVGEVCSSASPSRCRRCLFVCSSGGIDGKQTGFVSNPAWPSVVVDVEPRASVCVGHNRALALLCSLRCWFSHQHPTTFEFAPFSCIASQRECEGCIHNGDDGPRLFCR